MSFTDTLRSRARRTECGPVPSDIVTMAAWTPRLPSMVRDVSLARGDLWVVDAVCQWRVTPIIVALVMFGPRPVREPRITVDGASGMSSTSLALSHAAVSRITSARILIPS